MINKIRDLLSAPPAALAVSGGADSMNALEWLCRADRVPAMVITVDHGARPFDAEVAVVEAACKRANTEFNLLRVKSVCRSQEQFRDARYGLIRDLMQSRGMDLHQVCTAHTADDLVETFLHRMMRASHAASLRVTGSELTSKPFMNVTRADLRSAGAEFVEDPSNETDKYARNRIRHHVVPVLLEAGMDTMRLAGLVASMQQAVFPLDGIRAALVGVGVYPKARTLSAINALPDDGVLRVSDDFIVRKLNGELSIHALRKGSRR